MKKKKMIYIVVGTIISLVLFAWGALYLNARLFQGEYYHHKDGVTIEVTNSTDQTVKNLKYYFKVVPQALGGIPNLNPGESTTLYTPRIEGVGNDRSISFEYPLNDTSLVKDSFLYLGSFSPKKVIIEMEITDVNKNGKMSYRVKGYEDLFGKFEFEQDSNNQ